MVKRQFIINSQKIIIEYKNNPNIISFLLLIGNIDFSEFQIIPEILLKYNDEKVFNSHKNLLKKTPLNLFLEKHSWKNKIIEVNNIKGEIYIMNSEKINEINIDNKEIKRENDEYVNKLLKNENKCNIRFLFKIHLFLGKLKYKLKNEINNEENINFGDCYLFKKELIEKYIQFYEFDKIIKKYQSEIDQLSSSNEEELNDFYESLIKKYQEQFINKDLCEINSELQLNKSLFEVDTTRYNDPNFLCYENYILSDIPFKKVVNESRFNYIIIHQKILLIFNQNINIGILDEKSNIFVPEIIIKYDIKKDLDDMIYMMKNNGIDNFVSNFSGIYNDTNNHILLLKDIDENQNQNQKNEIKINNFFKEVTQQNNGKKINENKNNFDNNRKLELKKLQEKKQKQILSLKILISIILDSIIIERKTAKSLKGNNQEQYYFMNYKLFRKYIELKKVTEIYESLIANKIVESLIDEEIDDIFSLKELNVGEIIANLGEKKINNIQVINGNEHLLFGKNISQLDYSYLIKEEKSGLVYYENFILISKETYGLFITEFPPNFKFKLESFPVYFGSGKIFIEITPKNLIEIGVLDNNNIFQLTMLFEHNNKNQLKTNIKLLLSNGYTQYQKYYLLFNDDFISPIFDTNNEKIGQAFRFDGSFNDYSKFIKQEEIIKNMIKLYFLNYRIKIKFNEEYNIDINPNIYYIINENYLKKFNNYPLIEKMLNHVDISNEFKSIMNCSQIVDRETKYDKLFDNKKFSIIIKNLLSDKNINNYQNENDQNISPNLAPISCNSIDLFYFENFRLVDQKFYNNLKQNNINLFKSVKTTVSCIFIETYILINVTNYNTSNYNYIAEICEINEQNIIKPIYLLALYDFKYLRYHLNYVLNIFGNFKGFLESLCFSQGNEIKLNIDITDRTLDVGYIYKISGVLSNQNIIQNIPNNNMNNISINNSNIINFSNPNININLSVPINITNAQTNNSINNNNSNFSQQIIVPPPIPIPPPPIPDPIIIDSIEKEFTIPPLKGLKNVGATCYMNATLQCFCNIKQFVNYFKYKLKDENLKKLNNEKKVNLTSSFKYLIENIWQTPGNKYINPKNNTQNANNKYYIPIRFKERISIMNPLFEGAQANDAKDLVNFLIMTLHEELNKAPKIQNINSSNLLINQSNKQDVFNNFILTFANENISLISDLFYAVNNNITECLNCGNQKYNYQIYFFLNFPLEEVRKFKIDNNQFIQANQIMMSMNPMFCQQNFINNNQIINSVNLDDCFRYNQKIENFSGENSMYCNICQTQSPAVYKTILTTGPEILIIILNRGKGIQFKVKCEFVSQLNLYEYIEMKNTGFMYDLIGVVTHIGEDGPSGHFIAYCRSPIDNNWYQYNDDLVFPVKDFVNEVINYAMPYILFYQKIK